MLTNIGRRCRLPVMSRTASGALSSLRASNRDQLLALLRTSGALHRAELARRTRLSRTTVSSIVAELIAEGLVVERPAPEAARDGSGHAGRPGELLTVNPAAGLIVGVDVSYTEVRAVAVDLAHQVLAERIVPHPGNQDARETLAIAARTISDVVTESGIPSSRVVGVGLGVPGPVNRRTNAVVASTDSLLQWTDVPAADELAAEIGFPVLMDNTSHLGSLGEITWGAGAGCRDVVYVKLASGIGAGFTFNGEIYEGCLGAAGEFGHVTVDELGPACRCGNRGCLEVYAGGPAVCGALSLKYGRDVTLREVISAVVDGDRAASRVVADAGHFVGKAVANMCNLLNPERVVIGGDLAEAGEVLLQPIRAAVTRLSLAISADAVEVVAGRLGPLAGPMGAVALVLQSHPELVLAPT